MSDHRTDSSYRRLNNTQQQSAHEHGAIVLCHVRQKTDDGPGHHKACARISALQTCQQAQIPNGHTRHVPRRANSAQNHVRGNLSTEVSHKQNRNKGIVLGAFELEILREGVELSVDHGISVEKVEKVHDPEHWLCYDTRVR